MRLGRRAAARSGEGRRADDRADTGGRPGAGARSGGREPEREAAAAGRPPGQGGVLNVWGSWCAPCRAEAPNLQKVYEDTREQGVAFLGINTRDATQSNALAFEGTYPSFWDRAGKLLLKFRGTISPSAIPSTLVIDRQGRIAASVMKALSERELRSMVDPVLKEG
ncbi:MULTISPECIES: TlpA disulfide reductase family protein [Streptomyces]|uniref:TlpA disulfide reductase family protein n=1 Tax=Streptomyces bacillaris TaxID=68179 RepID=A0ABW6DP62_9ACTN